MTIESVSSIRIAIMWSHMSAYMKACFDELSNTPGVDLLIYYLAGSEQLESSYDASLFTHMPQAQQLDETVDGWKAELLRAIAAFAPDVTIISGWGVAGYRYVALRLRRQGLYVIGACDNPWHGSVRQWLAVISSPWYIHSLFDALWVPGERAAWFGRHLGYRGTKLIYGLYTAHTRELMPLGEQRIKESGTSWPPRFLFAGRLEREKGISDLVTAYRSYRAQSASPWELWIAGAGTQESAVQCVEGVRLLGFRQPKALQSLLLEVGAFVLPSHYDPWPLVIHEMACAALPIICSRQCGSSVELVQEGFNGFRFEAGDSVGLSSYMTLMANRTDQAEYGENSFRLAARFSTTNWVSNLLGYIREEILPASRRNSN